MRFKSVFEKYPEIFLVLPVIFLVFTNSCVNEAVKVKVEIADSPEERRAGLMNRERLNENEGMIFIFEGQDYKSFWMKNTLMPLDLIFVSEDFTIVDIKENFLPCKLDPCHTYTSKEKAKYVLEVNSGFVKENNIRIKDKVKYEGMYVYFGQGY